MGIGARMEKKNGKINNNPKWYQDKFNLYFYCIGCGL